MRVALETANMYPSQGGVYTYYVELLRHLGGVPEPPELSLIEGLRYRDMDRLKRDLAQLDWDHDPMLRRARFIRPRRIPVGALMSRPGPWRWSATGRTLAGAFDRRAVPALRQRAQWTPALVRWFLPPSLVSGIDVFHWSDAVFFRVPGRPSVATIYDTIPLTHPEWCTPEQTAYHSRHLATVATQATRIMVISDSTKRDVVRVLGVDESRIDVIPLGVGTQFRPCEDRRRLHSVLARHGLENHPYVLYAGNTKPHKNLPRLIAAFRAAIEQDQNAVMRLVLAGSIPEADDPVRQAIEAHGLGDRVLVLGRVSNDDLPALMAGSTAVACVSLYEGFGLPALEAMASGAPVVASNGSSLPEVVGDAGLLVDPSNERDIAAALRSIWTDPGKAATFRERGLRRAREFSWDRTARLTLESYRRAAAGT